MNLIKYIKKTIQTNKFENKISTLTKQVLAQESNNIISHNKGKLIRQKASWGELKHNFVPGIYLRQMILNPGSIIISGIHKRDHVWFLLEGDITIVNKDGEENYIAPYVGFSKSGIQRVIRSNEYSIFQNVFPNPSDSKDLDFVEKYNYALTKKEYKEYIKNK
tara:strand:- start:554 stop:1042 length:489 start_codon:yes stop_codon:yes gene_type:complete